MFKKIIIAAMLTIVTSTAAHEGHPHRCATAECAAGLPHRLPPPKWCKEKKAACHGGGTAACIRLAPPTLKPLCVIAKTAAYEAIC